MSLRLLRLLIAATVLAYVVACIYNLGYGRGRQEGVRETKKKFVRYF